MDTPGRKRETTALIAALAAERADRARAEMVLQPLAKWLRSPGADSATLRDLLADPYHCLVALYGHYAFSRRGKERQDLAEIATEALARTTNPDDIGQFLSLPSAEVLWNRFVEVCDERRRKPLEQQNAGAIAGMAELAQEIYRLDGSGSIATWLARSVHGTRRLETPFLRMVDVRGVGPKLASLFTRDVMLLHELEPQIEFADRIYVQPIDKWLRAIAPYVLEEPDAGEMPDWVLAGKFSKATRHAEVSGIRFNLGVTYFGLREVRDVAYLPWALAQLMSDALKGHP